MSTPTYTPRTMTFKDAALIARMHKYVDEIRDHAEIGDIDSLASVVDDLGALLGEVQEFIDYASE